MPPPPPQPELTAAQAGAGGVAKANAATEGPATAAAAVGRYKKSDPLLKAPLPLPAPPSRTWRSPKIRPPATPGDSAAALAEVPASAETILGSKAPAEPALSLGSPSPVSASADASPTSALELASSSATPASVSSTPPSSAVSGTATAKISLTPALAPGVSSLNAPPTATGVLLASSPPKKLTRPFKPVVVAVPPLDSHAKDDDDDAVENDGYFDPLEEYFDDIGPPSRAGSDPPSTQDLDWAGDITQADLEEELAAIEEVLDGPIGNPMSKELGPVIPDSLLPANEHRNPDDGRSKFPASNEAGAMEQMREMMLEIAAIEALDEAANNAGLDADVSSDSVLGDGDDGLIVADDVPPPLEDSEDPYIAGDSTDDGRENNHKHHVKGLGKHEKKKKHKSKDKNKKTKHDRRPKHARPYYQDSSDGGESNEFPAVDQNTHIIDLSSENTSLNLPQAAGPTNATDTTSLRALARAALGRGGVLLGLGDTTAGAVAAGTLAAFVFLASLSIVAAVIHCACAARRRARAAERHRAAWFRAAGRVRYQPAGADDPDHGAAATDGDDGEEKVPNVPRGEEDDDDDDTLGSGDGVATSGARGGAGPWASSDPSRAGDVFVVRSG
ncbi:hypothetical protein HK405_003720, partial [Cladochytrium tenue]